MAVGKTLMALGAWIEKRFPEKVSAAEVYKDIDALATAVAELAKLFHDHKQEIAPYLSRISDLEKKAENFSSDISKTKLMLITQRQAR